MGDGTQLLALEGAPAKVINRDGIRIECYPDGNGGQLLCAVVFADGYLPASVRRCVEEGGEQIGSSSLYLDEALQRVLLVANWPAQVEVEPLLSPFVEIANYWHRLLNERGSRDLIPVRKG